MVHRDRGRLVRRFDRPPAVSATSSFGHYRPGAGGGADHGRDHWRFIFSDSLLVGGARLWAGGRFFDAGNFRVGPRIEPAGQRVLDDPSVQQTIRETLLNRKDQLLKAAYYEIARDEAKVVNYLAVSIAGSDKK